MASLEELLVLQGHDTSIEQLTHRRANLPERDQLVALAAELASIDASRADVTARREAVARAQKRLEDEVATVEAKAVDVNAKLYGGSVTSPRELQALQDDEASLRRHQGTLEDKVIEQMELAEPLDTEADALTARRAEVVEQTASTESRLTVAEAELDAGLAGELAAREEVAATIDAALLEQYDQLRHDLGGIAVARLIGSNCGGCHLTLSAVELDRIRHQPEGQLTFCGECGRLLVR